VTDLTPIIIYVQSLAMVTLGYFLRKWIEEQDKTKERVSSVEKGEVFVRTVLEHHTKMIEEIKKNVEKIADKL